MSCWGKASFIAIRGPRPSAAFLDDDPDLEERRYVRSTERQGNQLLTNLNAVLVSASFHSCRLPVSATVKGGGSVSSRKIPACFGAVLAALDIAGAMIP